MDHLRGNETSKHILILKVQNTLVHLDVNVGNELKVIIQNVD